MATPLLDLIRAIIPNFSSQQLRGMIPWFEGVSQGIERNSRMVAAAVIDGGANIQRSFGLRALNPVTHGSAGNFTLHLGAFYDVNQLYVAANIYSPSSPPNGALDIYPTFADGETLNLAIWQIAATTAVRSQVDEQFTVEIWLAPSDQS